MGIAVTGEHLALQAAVRAWAQGVGTMTAVRRLEPSSGRPQPADEGSLWAGVAGIGVLGAAVPEGLGGAGGNVLDTAVALEAAATALVPGPVLPTVLAGIVLARHADPATAKDALEALTDGSLPAAVALGPDNLRARPDPHGGIRVDGEAGVVLGASDASRLVLAARGLQEETWFTVPPGHAGVEVLPCDPVDFSRPIGNVRLTDALVPAEWLLRSAATSEVAELAAVLAAAEAAGIADRCLHIATEYARVREQFGRPIGSFQAVKHLCAQMLCRVEEAAAVAWDAARAADPPAEPTGGPDDHDADGERALAAAVAAGVALDAAVENAKACIQVLGGIGFTWEHDAHLYLRRALAARQWLGGSARWRRRAAQLVVDGVRRRLDPGHLPASASDAAGEREGVRSLAVELAGLPPQARRARLADSGNLVPHWPPPYGRGASAAQQLVIDDELRAAGIERPDLVVGGWAVPTILAHGTPEQCDRFAGPTLRGEITWCQLFSEPGAGSDLASLRTRAVRVADGWRLTGQKVWTSLAHEADWGICLARTDPEQPRHRGITLFLVDMTSPGIQIRPLREITGDERFSEVFLDGVVVPDTHVVGAVNDGWRLARTTLAEERVAIGGGSALGEGLEHLVERVGATSVEPVGWDRLGALVGEGSAVSLIGLRSAVRRLLAAPQTGSGAGSGSGAEAAVLKLVGVRHRQAVAEAALELLGAQGAVVNELTRPDVHEALLTRCLSIAGGTTQILLTLAAERSLGLPREPTP